MASLEVLVTPRAAAERVGPVEAGVLRVRVTRPPVDGEANRAVERLIARALDLPASGLRLLAGERSRRKRFAIDALSEAELAARLARLEGPAD
jgi:uncharacterized protein YggU (UPF0235/DUF167 family)